jgi:hypothetical protein
VIIAKTKTKTKTKSRWYAYAILYGLDRLTSVNEQGVNDHEVASASAPERAS